MGEEFFVCEIGALEDNDSLVELKIANVGKWSGHHAGMFEITADSLAQIKQNFDALKNDCVIDYEHNSIKGVQNPAAGWVKSLDIRENALFAKVAWNPKAREFIKNGEYKYLSPTFQIHYKNPKTGEDCGVFLHSVALTNTPFLDCLGEVKANKIQTNKGETMDLEKRIQELEAENQSLKKQIAKNQEEVACSVVEGALVACKITQSQKEWALDYAKKDLNGFSKFLESAIAPQAPQNNLFANKQQAEQEAQLITLALGETK